MDKARPGNDLNTAVPKFCLTLEEFRRTPEGRIRTSREFLDHFCPHTETSCTDRIFRFIPNDVRGPILAAWGIRGQKTAARDTDEKVQSILFESLLAGDIDHDAFEEGLTPTTVVRWAPLADYWQFWRTGKLTKSAIRRALESGYELSLFDAKWFLDTIEAQGGKLRGTDVLSEGLSKADLTAWVRGIHASRDGSPRGLLAALGWESIVLNTADPILIAILDAMALKIGLQVPSPAVTAAAPDKPATAETGRATPAPATRPARPNSATFAAVAAPVAPPAAALVAPPVATPAGPTLDTSGASVTLMTEEFLTDDDLDMGAALDREMAKVTLSSADDTEIRTDVVAKATSAAGKAGASQDRTRVR